MKSTHSLWDILFTRVAGLTFIDWAVATAYAVYNIVQPTVPNGYFYQIATGDDGTSHAATEPTWPTTVGATVVDQGATWTTMAVGLAYQLSVDTTLNDFMRAAVGGDLVNGLADSVVDWAAEDRLLAALKSSVMIARG